VAGGIEKSNETPWDSMVWDGSMALRHTGTEVDLALDLLTGPASGLDGAFAILSGLPGLPYEGGNPRVGEVRSNLAIGERVGKVTIKTCQKKEPKSTRRSCLPNNTHSRAHKAFAAVALLRDDVQKVEDRLNEWLELSDCNQLAF
jgi:hypothetical protein